MFEAETHDLLRKIIWRLDVIIGLLIEKQNITPTSITFQESTMLSPTAGNTLVYIGTLSPAGAVYPTDSTFTLISSDPTVTPSVDATGLIVTIPLPPAPWVDNPASPLTVGYTATSVSTPSMVITSSIVPSIPTPPPVIPTGITFAQSV